MSRPRSNARLNVFNALRRVVLVSFFAMVGVLGLTGSPDMAAKAPPHATTLVTTGVFATPDLTSDQVGSIDPGAEVELTGNAAPGFLGVVYGEGEAWIPSTNLTTGVRPRSA